jgi:xanthine dehydrogenase accessory factor
MANETTIEVLQAALDALQDGQRAALLTVVRALGSTPRHSGAKMLVRSDGSMVGTIGGGALEERSVIDAQQAIGTGRSVLRRYEFSGKAEDSVGLCGGAVDVSIDVLIPAARLLIIGAGHIAQSLAAIAAVAGMDVMVVDDRPEWAARERFPTAKQIHIVAYDRARETLAPIPVKITPSTAILLATWGWDEPALRQVIGSPAFYIGLVASRRKLKLIMESLSAHGVDPALIDRVHAPAGLDLGSETPGEIALAIMAEILLIRNNASGQPLTAARKLAAAGAPPLQPSSE